MRIEEIAPRLWSWSGRHPEWKQEVFSYALAADDAFVVFDPLVEDWTWLDGRVEQHGPPAILITVYFHVRSARQVLDRYDGSTLWGHEPALKQMRKRIPETRSFDAGDALPGGIEAVAMHHMDEAAFWLPSHSALVVGDSVVGKDDRAELSPPSWLRKRETVDEQRASVEHAMDRGPALLLLTHGGPMDPEALEV